MADIKMESFNELSDMIREIDKMYYFAKQSDIYTLESFFDNGDDFTMFNYEWFIENYRENDWALITPIITISIKNWDMLSDDRKLNINRLMECPQLINGTPRGLFGFDVRNVNDVTDICRIIVNLIDYMNRTTTYYIIKRSNKVKGDEYYDRDADDLETAQKYLKAFAFEDIQEMDITSEIQVVFAPCKIQIGGITYTIVKV